jgi:uncharacterized protein YbcI
MTRAAADAFAGIWVTAMTVSDPAELQRSISRAVVGLWSARFGKGPDRARTYLNDENVVVVMYGGLLAHEQTLIAAGDHDAVRALRMRFEQALRPEMKAAVEAASGRRVLTFDSAILFEPTRTFELFVLGD